MDEVNNNAVTEAPPAANPTPAEPPPGSKTLTSGSVGREGAQSIETAVNECPEGGIVVCRSAEGKLAAEALLEKAGKSCAVAVNESQGPEALWRTQRENALNKQ